MKRYLIAFAFLSALAFSGFSNPSRVSITLKNNSHITAENFGRFIVKRGTQKVLLKSISIKIDNSAFFLALDKIESIDYLTSTRTRANNSLLVSIKLNSGKLFRTEIIKGEFACITAGDTTIIKDEEIKKIVFEKEKQK